MAIHNYRYSRWDGSQDVPDFSADDLLQKMSDDLLRGGDPERALRNLLRRGFELPDGRRFEGMKRLRQKMREYRNEAMQRYDPGGLVDKIREQLQQIVEMERAEIDQRRGSEQKDGPSGQTESPESDVAIDQPSTAMSSEPSDDASNQAGKQSGSHSSGQQDGSTQSDGSVQPTGSGETAQKNADEFRKILERMLERKEEYLDQVPSDNAGRIKALREYDFLSQDAREAFERLVGGMQRELMEQYFQGLKQGIGQMTPDQMDAVRQMVRDMNDMIEASQAGDRGAFDRFMQQYGDSFPEGIETLEDLLEHMQRQMSAMQALLDSMDPDQRAELEAMMDELLRDDRLRLDLARLGANMAQMSPTVAAILSGVARRRDSASRST